ncbi:hypothetical protein [Streptomyces carpaticus]|uniref:hypothetical protein n=1 Tax=Streptomyces carpaticus TaxID=285558 RepID=UPI0031F78A97
MTLAADAYLPWEPLGHAPGCALPQWDADVLSEPDELRMLRGGPAHSCPNADECGHGARMDVVTVRLVCRSCDRAHLIKGEEHSRRSTSTRVIGYGETPRRMSGLVLWPGPPLVEGPDAAPLDYLVTRTRVDRVTEADVAGLIGQHRGPRGGTCWWATAVPDPHGEFGAGGPIRMRHRAEGLRSLAAAARWCAAKLADPGTETDR